MRKTLRYLVAAALALCLTQAFALAAAPVDVQLDGEAVAFTDAAPQIVNDRTFLPVRAVFEAMGATVDYNDGVVTAVRGGKTVTMTIGSTEASVAEDGVTTPITMDVAPFIDPALSRTYVPVRFAAQALGANVGWDADTRTVVIVDTEKKLAELLSGKSFTCLEKLAAYSRKYNEGVWSSELALKGTVNIDLAALDPGMPISRLSVPAEVVAKGVTANSTKLDVTETVKADLSALKALFDPSGEGADAAEAAELTAMIDALAARGVVFSVRGDMDEGKLYMNFDLSALGDAAAMSGLDSAVWYSMDVKSLYDEMGLDYAGLMTQSQNFDMEALLSQLLSGADVNDSESYAVLNAMLTKMAAAFSDAGFTGSGSVRTATFEQEVEGITLKLALSLTMKDDAVAAFGVEMTMNGDLMGEGELAMSMKMAVSEQDKLSGSLTVNAMNAVDAAFDITGGYARGGSAPATQPPADARTEDLMNMTAGLNELSSR